MAHTQPLLVSKTRPGFVLLIEDDFCFEEVLYLANANVSKLLDVSLLSIKARLHWRSLYGIMPLILQCDITFLTICQSLSGERDI
jgi:hypothetical protein